MPTVWNPERWTHTGYNEAGDVIYERSADKAASSGVAAKSSSSLTKAELQELAEARGLPTSGSKADLLDRLSGVGS